jgi:hypothetical protein
MTTGEAAQMFRQAVANGEDPAEAAAIVDGAIGGYWGRKAQDTGTEQRLRTLEENVAWTIQSLAKLTDAVMRLNAAMKAQVERQKEVEGEL